MKETVSPLPSELTSPSTAKRDHTTKKAIYEKTFKTSEYYCFDPDTNLLEGWRLRGGVYREITADERGWMWCENLRLWLGTWDGKYLENRETWLRFYDQAGNLVLLESEFENQRAETEKQRAETEKQRAETEKQRADEVSLSAGIERKRAEDALAEAARLRVMLAELQTKLSEHGGARNE